MASANANCHPPRFIDLTGRVFGRWIVVELWTVVVQGVVPPKNLRWLCHCACGTRSVVAGADLRRGRSSQCRSCGSMTHGLSHLPEHKVWEGLKCRCECPSATGHSRYGGRGISVSDEWLASFETFYRDMGPRPTPKHTLERINNDGPYSKANCRWDTRTAQMRNMSRNHTITFNGKTQCLQEWAEEVGLNKATLRKRLRRGWSAEMALTTPARNPVRSPSDS